MIKRRLLKIGLFSSQKGVGIPSLPSSTVVFNSEPIASNTGYSAMTSVSGTGVIALGSTGTSQKIAQTEPEILTSGVSSKRVVEFEYTASEFAGKSTATNFFYVGNPVEGEYERISPASTALQAGSVVGLVCDFSTGDIQVYVDGVLDSTVNSYAIETNSEQHIGFTTNGTCSVTCVADGGSMNYLGNYGPNLEDWEGNTLT